MCPITERLTFADDTGLGRGLWKLIRCRETGFVFLANPPDYARLEEEFAWEKTMPLERERRKVDEPIIAKLSEFAKSTKKYLSPKRNKIAAIAFSATQKYYPKGHIELLDIGCGKGKLMVELHRRFIEAGRSVAPRGIEVSRQLAKESHARVSELGGEVISANALEGIGTLPKESINLVTMSSFLEHEFRPLSLLRLIDNVLEPNGIVVLKIPNFASWNRFIRGKKWCGFRLPDHVNYFTPKTLGILAQEAGFHLYRQKARYKYPFSDSMYAVLTKASRGTK